jgi:cytochrome c oxidase subunit 2
VFGPDFECFPLGSLYDARAFRLLTSCPMHSTVLRRGRSAVPLTVLLSVLAGHVLFHPAGGLAAAPSLTPASLRQTPEPRVVEVLAKRYAFEPSEIEVTEGERVRLVVRSGDGLHGLEIKRFNVSKEIPRGGEPVIIEFTAGEAGRFPILCSLDCGDGHGDMKGVLVVTARAPAQPEEEPTRVERSGRCPDPDGRRCRRV